MPAPWGIFGVPGPTGPAGPPGPPEVFTSVQGAFAPPLNVPGDAGSPITVSSILGHTSATGKIRLIATAIGAPDVFGSAPGAATINYQLLQDGGITGPFVNAYGNEQISNTFGEGETTVSFEWIANVDLAAHTYALRAVYSSPLGLPGDTFGISRYTLTVEDVQP